MQQHFKSLFSQLFHYSVQYSAFSIFSQSTKNISELFVESLRSTPTVSMAIKQQKTGWAYYPFKGLLCLFGKFHVKLHMTLSDTC